MDSLVQGTNDSSTLSKLSMVSRGYFQDEVIHHFAAKEVRRSPLIHLGYFVRALVMDRHVRLFLESADSAPQVLSLGAGFDTTFFRLKPSFPNMSYFEVDLLDVVRNKISIIRNSMELSSIVSEKLGHQRGVEPDNFSSEHYSIFYHDLSCLEGLVDKLQHHGFDFNRPTLIFSECAITYLEEERFLTAKLRPLEREDIGWAHCQVVCVMDLVQQLLSASEFSQIFKKEPFDEWEEFHLKCCHYSLAVASHETSLWPESNLQAKSNGTHEVRSETFVNVNVTPLEQLKLERFAHAACRLSDGAALVIGGFGAIPGYPHSRCSDVQYVGNRRKTVHVSSQPQPSSFHCLHFTCTPVGRDEFVIYGGRTSPARETNSDPSFLTVSNQSTNDLEVLVQKMKSENCAQPKPRWRHAATPFHGAILVFGGRNRNVEVFGDLWELTITGRTSCKWREIRPDRNHPWPKPRFSLAFASSDNSAYLSGGLGADFRPLNDVWELTKIDGELVWKQLQPNGAVPCVYSHDMHIYRNQLILLGGVNASHSDQPQLTVIDLPTLSTRRYSLRVVGAGTFLLHNFSSIISYEDDSIISYGGGGNCFSFGTHFNKVALKLSNLLELR